MTRIHIMNRNTIKNVQSGLKRRDLGIKGKPELNFFMTMDGKHLMW